MQTTWYRVRARAVRGRADESSRTRTRRQEFPALPPRLKRGHQLGRYIVESEIARGTSSVVFRARAAEGPAALKVLSPHLAIHPEAVQRFEEEHLLAAQVRHLALVRVTGAGRQGDYHYYAMGLEEGGTLESRCLDESLRRDEPFLRDLCARFAELAWAVHALHRHGIVHRDIKPSNILVGRGGGLVLTDFGSALDACNRRPERDAAPGGTVYYMSPEQLLPGADLYDPLGDVYALGVSLYEAASGKPPFPELTDREMASWKLRRIPQAPRLENPRISLALDRVIRRAMESHRTLRYANAAELARHLERLADRRRGRAHDL